jgi:formylglycine-generating enzyme required for sulfatase activity
MAECIAFSPNHRQLLTKYGDELVDPAFGMSWNDSANFCVWLTTQARGVDTDAAYRWIATPEEEENRAVVVELDLTAPGFRLPTEAEWEIACRAGNASTFSFGDDETLLPYYGVSFENAKDGAMPIKSFRPNQRGMFDMHGNITEWCHDSHGSIPQAVLRDYAGATPSFDRCVRGGSFVTRHHVCESAIRDHATADTKVAYGGFRIGMTLPEAE